MQTVHIGRAVVAIAGVLFAGIALAIWIVPGEAARILGLEPVGAVGTAVMRADVGGLFAGLANRNDGRVASRCRPDTCDQRAQLFRKCHWPGDRLFGELLREPVARALSHFRHIGRSPDHYLHEWAQGRTLEQFLDEPALVPLWSNYQARHLVFEPEPRIAFADRRAWAGALWGGSETYHAPGQVVHDLAPIGFDGAELRDRAVSALAAIAWVLSTELLDDALPRLSRAAAWTTITATPRDNVNTSAPPSLSEASRVRILEANAIDLELHAMAMARSVGFARVGDDEPGRAVAEPAG